MTDDKKPEQTKPEADTALETPQLGLLETVRLGICVYASEMKWLGRALLKKFEISRLAKRLEEEYTRLGRLTENPKRKKQEKELCLKQLSFLKDEIETLKSELEARRIQRVNKLRGRQGHEPVNTKP